MFRFVLGADIRMVVLLLVAVATYFLIPMLSLARCHGASRGLLTLLPPVVIVASAGIVSEGPVTSFKFALLSVILVPILVALSVTLNAWLSCVMFTIPMLYLQRISDLWGDTVNVASRMESQGSSGSSRSATPRTR